jgi:YD repeat-containing protein
MSYDGADRLFSQSVANSTNTTTPLWSASYAYDAAGRRAATLYGGSVSRVTNTTTGDSYWLDGTGQITSVLYGSPTALSRSTNQGGIMSFQYDEVGNRTSVTGSTTTNGTNGTSTNWTTSYTANNLNQYSSTTSALVGTLGYLGRGRGGVEEGSVLWIIGANVFSLKSPSKPIKDFSPTPFDIFLSEFSFVLFVNFVVNVSLCDLL